VAVALAAVAVVRDAGWVVWPALIASVMVASLAASGGTAWRQVGVGLIRIGGAVGGGVEVVRGAPRAGGVPALRAAGIGVVLLAVFVPLFATADAAPALANLACAAEPPPDGLAGFSVARARARAALDPKAASC
jgi:hypothetical protein